MFSLAAVKSALSWQTALVAIQALIQLILLTVLVRLLDPTAFGLVALANVAIAFGQLLSEAGAGPAVVQRQRPVDHSFVSAAFLLSVGIGAVFVVLQVASAGWLERFFGVQGLKPVLIALSLVFLIVGSGRVCEALLQRDLKFQLLMKINVAAQVFGYAIPAILLAVAGYGVWALVAGTILQALLRTGLYIIVTRGGIGMRTSWPDVREVFLFGAGVTKLKLWHYVMQQGDRFVIGRHLGVNPVGQYQVSNQLACMPTVYLGYIVDAVFFPVLSRLNDEPDKRNRLFVLLMSYGFALMFGIGIFLAANGSAIVNIMLGERWVSATPVFQIIALGTGFRMLSCVGEIANRAVGQVFQAAMRKMILAIMFLTAVWFSAPYGLLTVCWAVIAVQFVGAILIGELAIRGVNLRWAEALPGLAVAGIGLCAVTVINGSLFLAERHIDLSPWTVLAVSIGANAAAALWFLSPLLRLWFQGNLSPKVG